MSELETLRKGFKAALFYLSREIRKDVRSAALPDTSKFDDHYKNALADMRAAYRQLADEEQVKP